MTSFWSVKQNFILVFRDLNLQFNFAINLGYLMMNIFDQLHGALSFYIITYNFLLLGDFNISSDDECLKEFCNSFSLGHLIKTLKHQNTNTGTNPSSIDHNITNVTSLFMESCNKQMGYLITIN